MPLIKDKNWIFIHIPKTGGTAVTKYFTGDKEMPVVNGLKKPLQSLESENVVYPGHHIWYWYRDNAPEEWRYYLKTSIVRDPVDRLLSAFYYAKMEDSWWHGEDKDSGLHPDYELLKDKSFDEFLDILKNNRNSLTHHSWVEQWKWIFNSDGYLMIDDIYYYEKLNKMFSEKFGINLPIINKTRKFNISVSQDQKNLIKEVYKKDYELLKYE